MPARIADIEQFAAQRAVSRCAMGPVAPRGALERAVRPPRSRAPRDSACFLAFSCLLRTDGVGSADFPPLVRSVLPAAHRLAGLRSHRRSPQWAASAATARPAGFCLRSASLRHFRGLCGLPASQRSRELAWKVRVLLPQLLRNQLQVRGGLGTAKTSFSVDVDQLSTPCCSRDGLRCARHAMHASCTHRRTGRTPCSRRERTIAHAKSTPSANAARMPCAHQVHRSRTRG